MAIKWELLLFVLLTVVKGLWAGSFTVLNNCGYTVWPGFLSNGGMAPLTTTGFELPPGTTRVVKTPAQWSGRLWGQTACTFGPDDCGGRLQCDGAGVFLNALTLNPEGLDLYDVSIVDDYYLPMVMVASRSTGAEMATGCVVDINLSCPMELRLDDGNDNVLPCKSACKAIGSPQYCCIEAYANPNTCLRAYSYAFHVKTSTLTCADSYYAVTFCPPLATGSQSSSISTSLTTNPMVSAGTSNSNGAGKIIIGDSKVQSTAASSVPSWTSILTGLLLTKTLILLILSV